MPEYAPVVTENAAGAPAGGEADSKKEWGDVITDAQKERISFVYAERSDMVLVRDDSYVQFNDRTLKEFIDDSEKRLNAYVLDRQSQGKEDWQANFSTRAYANKAKALLAATARDVPDMHISAVNDDDQFDHFVEEVTKSLVKHSYAQDNAQEDLFFLGWSNLGHGTVLSYEGFDIQSYERKRIKSYNLLTGDVEEEVVKRESYGEPVSYELGLMDVLIKNAYIRNIQDQPAIIIEEYYADEDRFKAIYGKYPNSIYVKDAKDFPTDKGETYFHAKWKEALGNKQKGFYVCRYMNKFRNPGSGIYRIVANGVELFNGPMMWRDVGRRNFGRPMYLRTVCKHRFLLG